MPKLLLILVILSTFTACNFPQDDDLLARQDEFKEILKPDNTFKILDSNYYKKEIAKFQALNETLQDFEMDRLLPENQSILKDLNQQVQDKLWRLNTFKIHQWNPTQYNVMEQIQAIYTDTLNARRAKTLLTILQQIPKYYEAAKQNIQQPTRFHTKLAIRQQENIYFFLANDLADFLNKAKPDTQSDKSKSTSEIENALQFHQEQSLLAVKDFLGFLNSCINNADDGNKAEVLNTLEDKRRFFLQRYSVDDVDNVDWVNFEIYKTY